jgi:hypothetical protein
VATKQHRRHAKSLIECLESRVHIGPPIHEAEIVSAREFLRQHDFSPASDYFNRLGQLRTRLDARSQAPALPVGKHNYGGEAGGHWMQLQSAYDHLILSTCHEGDFNMRHGRVKLSHRFNQEGRIDFVELKFLRSLHPCLNGEIRKLLLAKGYQDLRKDWRMAEAFVLPVLPQELVFLYEDIFRCPKSDLFGWLINIGHRLAGDLLTDLSTRPVDGSLAHPRENTDQLCLHAIRTDDVAMPILGKTVALEAAVELTAPETALVRYCQTG